MKKWKSNKGLKVFLAVVSVISSLTMMASAVAIALMADYGIYEEPKKDVLERAYANYSNIYMVMAMANRQSDKMKEELSRTNFRYGILKAENLERVDLSNPDNYVTCNFETMPAKNALNDKNSDIQSGKFEVREGTEYYWDCRVGGHAGYYNPTVEEVTGEIAIPIIGYYYNTADGIFYYETEEAFYRVNSVALPVGRYGEILNFEYDSGQKAYYNKNIAECLLTDYYLTFNSFDNTTAFWETWTEIVLDGITMDRGAIIFSEDGQTENGVFLGKPISTDYYAYIEDGSQIIRYEKRTKGSRQTESYWVVYQVQNPLRSTGIQSYNSIFAGDLYEQGTAMIYYAYLWRYLIIVILAVSFILWTGSTILLLVAAGHKGGYETYEVPVGEAAFSSEEAYERDEKETIPTETRKRWADRIRPGFWQKIPLDLETVVLFFCIGCMMMLFVENGLWYLPSTEGIIVTALSYLTGYLLGLIWLTDFVVRIKLKKWWGNSILYKVGSCVFRFLKKWVGKIVSFLRENLNLLWRALLWLGLFCLLEFFGILITGVNPEVELLIWFLYRAACVLGIMLGIVQADKLKSAAQRMAQGDLQSKVNTEKMFWEFKKHGESLNNISDGLSKAVEQRMQSEHFRTELITNVSHDIKTPLTSIVNYVDLLQKENIDNEKVQEYLEVLSRQSARLKKLTEDLVEASKASTGNIQIQKETLELGVFLTQTLGEFQERLADAGLQVVMHKPEEEIQVQADGRHLYRVVDNLLQNICKYGMPDTRVYIDLIKEEKEVMISFKNISRYELNISGEALMERFVRGDASRHTEGSGLGLSIAQSLMELMGGKLELIVDGDLFKVILHFPQ